MIRNRLKELMIERGLKASRLAHDIPNLSRNTINTTANNNGKMLQLETINSLCEYLEVTPKDFFEYLPFDVEVSIDADNDYKEEPTSINDDQYKISPFYLNLYINKTVNSVNKGLSQETFELSIVCKDGIKTTSPIFNGQNEPVLDSCSMSVVLGNPPLQTSKDRANIFVDFWESELSAGFQEMIKTEIKEKLLDYFDKEVFTKTNEFIGWQLPAPINLTYNFDASAKSFQNLNNGIVYHDVLMPF
ncbi:MAG TPA: helix-turn-helix transcriptional regulator [Candidatus Limosilactobacillus intestinavium]|nr:helix-turn-helix transcriptional regulator [Candidatus Limosilactobacillus intestinavium]